MSLLARNRRVATLARSFSTEAPKIRIAQGILRLSQIQRAKDENELKKALSAPAAAIDLANLPKELAGLERYFAGAATTASGSAFTADKTAWQNTDWASFIGSEVGRYEVWPFAVGFGFVFAGALLVNATFSAEQRKNSKYGSLLERNLHGDKHGSHGHHAH